MSDTSFGPYLFFSAEKANEMPTSGEWTWHLKGSNYHHPTKKHLYKDQLLPSNVYISFAWTNSTIFWPQQPSLY